MRTVGRMNRHDEANGRFSQFFANAPKNISDESYRETRNSYFMFNRSPPPPKIMPFEIMWQNSVEQGRLHTAVRRMCIVSWIPKAINIHTCCVILLLLHRNNGRTNVSECYLIRTPYTECLVVFRLCVRSKYSRVGVVTGYELDKTVQILAGT
jgi:hypothetical protein